MKNVISPVKGTRDFYPENMAVRNWLYTTFRAISESFGYQEYDAPMLETIDLYAAKSGEELVNKQSYVFPDRSGDMITLRPELTPSLARMVAQRQHTLTFPLRWWSFGPFWRYERPQKGRTREFYQWNIDMIGVDSPEADAELVTILATFFQRVGLTPKQVIIQVNSRELIDEELTHLDVPAPDRPGVLSFMDRRMKMAPAEWEKFGLELGLSETQLEGIKAFLADKERWRSSVELTRFFAAMDALGLSRYVVFDPSTVRGLAYYTGTVFEAFELEGDIKRSILGGGRYNNLMADVGGDPLPAVGFAMGDVVVSLVLEKLGLLPAGLDRTPARVMVTVFDETSLLPSYALASQLRAAGIAAGVYPEAVKLPKQLKYADRMGVRLALVLGPDEQAQGTVAVKNLRTGNQETVSREALVETVKRWLAEG